jgi:hypothetical protein
MRSNCPMMAASYSQASQSGTCSYSGASMVGDHYEMQPDELVAELNGTADYGRVTKLLKHRLSQWRA